MSVLIICVATRKDHNVKNNIDAVLFDLDGTLLDTGLDLWHAMNATLKKYDKTPIDYSYFRQSITHGAAGMIKQSFELNEKDTDFETIRLQFLDEYENILAHHTELFDGMETLLNFLDQQQLPWGIVTNKSTRFTLPLLEKMNLDQRAHCIVTGDTLEHMKPHPAPLLHACKLINKQPKRTLYIGDYKTDVEACRAANMPHIIVSYGYFSVDEHPDQWEADHIVDHADEIVNWLKQL